MARACPACGRPNGDAATTCIYCVAPLPPAEVMPPAPVETVGSAPGDRHLLILLPTEARPSLDDAASRPRVRPRAFVALAGRRRRYGRARFLRPWVVGRALRRRGELPLLCAAAVSRSAASVSPRFRVRVTRDSQNYPSGRFLANDPAFASVGTDLIYLQ